MNSHKHNIFLSALFHDVGKFWQRGKSEVQYKKHDFLSSVFMERLYNNDIVRFIIENHHIKNLQSSQETGIKRLLAEIVCEADSLASGEREGNKNVSQQEPLYSIFNKINLDKCNDIECNANYIQPICNLSIDNYKFPEKDWTKTDLEESYNARWSEFITKVQELDFEKTHPDTLLSLYKKYLWCVPSSSYRSTPDVSLYEHSRLVVAIAMCMYDELINTYKTVENIPTNKVGNGQNRQESRYILLCGDITGIQSYIYGIGHKGAAKALKGRSFLLNQVVDFVARYILDKFDLSNANLIYGSGGKFYLLLPKCQETKIKDKILPNLEAYFLEKYDGALGIVLGWTELNGKDFVENKISEKWTLVNEELEKNKRQKYSTQFGTFFKPFGVQGSVVQCQNTKKDLCTKEELAVASSNLTEDELYYKYLIKDSNTNTIKEAYCIKDADGEIAQRLISKEQYDSIRLGRELKKQETQIIAVLKEKEGNFGVLNKSFSFYEKNETLKQKTERIIMLNTDVFLQKVSADVPQEWKFYGGNWHIRPIKDEDNEDKTWEYLCDSAIGIKRLGVLRMDVDNLGLVFKDGLGKQASFSRVVQLSAMLDFFFCGYLNKLEKLFWNVVDGVFDPKEKNPIDSEELKNCMQIVYAGGDDIFIMGRWDVLPDVAVWINEEFQRFTGNNPCLTISAGISLFENKFPIYKAAQAAGEAEHKAKGKRSTKNPLEKDEDKPQKDAICFLGTNLSWKDFEHARQWKNILYEALTVGVDGKRLSKGLLSRLQQFYLNYLGEPNKKDGKYDKPNLWGKWRWQAAYSLQRYGKQYGVFEEMIKVLSVEMFTSCRSEQDFIILSNLIANWTDLLTREK